jgi:hypothetical protein
LKSDDAGILQSDRIDGGLRDFTRDFIDNFGCHRLPFPSGARRKAAPDKPSPHDARRPDAAWRYTEGSNGMRRMTLQGFRFRM